MGRRGLLVLLFALALAPLVLPRFFLQLLTEIAIVGLFATSFNLLMGFGGMVSFGHAAYFALGAYTAALLVKAAGVPMLLALPAAPVVAGLGALLFGVVYHFVLPGPDNVAQVRAGPWQLPFQATSALLVVVEVAGVGVGGWMLSTLGRSTLTSKPEA